LDAAEFAVRYLVSKLDIEKLNTLVVHPTCSTTEIDNNSALFSLAQSVAKEVIVPPNWNCCGFAGDRGFFYPELTKSATTHEAQYLENVSADGYVSSNRMCEIAMSKATEKGYVHILQILNEQSKELN